MKRNIMVASSTDDPLFESQSSAIFYYCQLYRKDENEEKETANGPI